MKQKSETFICMACQQEKVNPTWWQKHAICGECHKILKKSIYDCNSHELRIYGNFLLFLAGIKYSGEQEEIMREKRRQRKLIKNMGPSV